jgi:putative endonuclease
MEKKMIILPYWVYMLLVGDTSHGMNRKIYTGYTRHLMSRIVQHSGLSNTKGARITRKQPIELVYLEKFPSQILAMQREWQLKHESPYSQKKSKLQLIDEFKRNYGPILTDLNTKLNEHYELLETIVKVMKKTEKDLINEMKKG